MLDRTKIPKVSKDLLATADYIREHGWCQHVWGMPDGRVCILGAVENICRGQDWRAGRISKIVKALTARFGETVPNWNDAPGRTKEEVIEMLEKIAWEQVDAA